MSCEISCEIDQKLNTFRLHLIYSTEKLENKIHKIRRFTQLKFNKKC
jgi:hypothetical protein